MTDLTPGGRSRTASPSTGTPAGLPRSPPVPETITRGRLTLYVLSGVARHRDRDLGLTRRQFGLLLVFLQHEGLVMRPEHLYEKVWQRPIVGDTCALKNAVHQLRRKLAGSGFTIVAQRGQGYRFEPE